MLLFGATTPQSSGGYMIAFLLLQFVFAQNFNVSEVPGLIPLTPLFRGSSDLPKPGQPGKFLSPDESRQLGKTQDISLIDPDPSSVLANWSLKPTVNPESQVVIDLNRPFEFIETSPETIGRFGFAISQKDATGTLRTYRVRLDTRNHNVLLRRNLLRKIGYNIPATIYAPKLEVTFRGDFTRDQFLKDIKSGTFLEPERWVTDKQPSRIILQDAIIFPGAEDSFYNLARGDLTASVIQGRRVMNALLVPFSLTDVTESVNVFAWDAGDVFNNQLKLPYEESYIFTTTYEDARWVARKILKLSRQDFEQIVKDANYPIEVEKLLVEKLISKRNFLAKLLQLDKEYAEIKIDSKISYGEKLKDGKLALAEWPGYAQKFSYGDPEEPLSGDELFAFFKSKAITNVLSNVVTKFNDLYVPRTDLGFKIFDHQLDLAVEQFAYFIETGEEKRIPFGFWSTTFFNTNIIAAREIVTGSYLGTDNLVQLADVVGFSVDGGFYFLADGAPTPFSINGTAQGFVTRTYAHIKPISSIKAALKEPFRNILVPKLKDDLAQKLESVLAPTFTQLSEEEQQSKLTEVLTDFKNNLKVGESLIITTSLGGALGMNIGMGLSANVSAYTAWSASQSVINRLHILRRDEDTVQVFKDPAKINTLSFSAGLEAYVPIITFKYTRKKGSAETRFFTINIDDSKEENPDVIAHVKSLVRLLSRSKTDALASQQKPYVITHRFQENSADFNVFQYRSKSLKSEDWISVTHPNGFQKDFLRRTTGKRHGKNYEALAIDVVNSLLREYVEDENYTVASNNSGDPADSIKGSSVSQLFSFEGELKTESGRQVTVDPFINLTYKWRNWSLSKEQLLAIVFNINERFNYEFFNELDFQQTDRIKLSTVEIGVNIYREGIDYLSKFNRKEMEAMFARGNFPSYLPTPMDKPGSRVREIREDRERRRNQMYIGIFGKMFERFQTAYQTGDAENTFKYLSQLTTFGERIMKSEDFYGMFGGVDNIFVRSQVIGFREGDEREGPSLSSNSFGEIGSLKGNGPLRDIQNKVGIPESEFFIYWLLNKI